MLQKLVRRMTRFVIGKPIAESLAEVKKACSTVLNFAVKQSTPAQLTVSTMDCRRMPLLFKMTAYGMNGKTLMDFRLSKVSGFINFC